MLWDIFCEVIDNFGDIGVCWRLSADLASRGENVRLWVDDPSALAWMAPHGCPGVSVHLWRKPMPPADVDGLMPGDVWIESFGCEIPPAFVEAFAPSRTGAKPPVWLNLEYLSAEPYVERSHALPSPVMRGPAAGITKWFFYPGFTARTGGLLREQDVLQRQAAFDRQAWLAQLLLQCLPGREDQPETNLTHQDTGDADTRLVSLFCYEPPALVDLLLQLDADERPTRLLATPGRASRALEQALLETKWTNRPLNPRGQLSISYLPALTQRDYDHLLWACDLNFVRGEDSLVRALWAGKPFVWHIYPQTTDNAHHAKLEAFLQTMQAPDSLRQWHRIWNASIDNEALPPLAPNLPDWSAAIAKARTHVDRLPDLGTQLVQFVMEKR